MNSIIFSISIVLAKVSVSDLTAEVGNAKLLKIKALIEGLNESLRSLSLKGGLLCGGADRLNCFLLIGSV